MGVSKHRSVFPPAEQRGLKENFENYRSNLFTNCFFNDIADMRQLLDVNQMVKGGIGFDFNGLPEYMI